MQPLNRLERRGWAQVAQDTLRLTPGEARLLAHLVLDRPGGVCGYACLSGHLAPQPALTPPSRRLPTRMARIRNALRDLGLPSSVVENISEVGYRIDPSSALRIRALVEAVA